MTDEKIFFICMSLISALILYWVSSSLWTNKLISVDETAIMLKILTIVLTADYEAVSWSVIKEWSVLMYNSMFKS